MRVTACPTDLELAAFAEGRASPAERQRVTLHLSDCEACAALTSLLMKAAPPPPAEAPPRYELQSQAGAGAMGSVFIAYDRVLKRQVALKWLTGGEQAPATLRERLHAEATALAKVTHPNVVRVYDVLSLDGEEVMAMELVVGQTLRDWLGATPRSRDAVLDVFRQAAHGLDAAHAAGLVHRDFKPANCLVGTDGVLRLVDFGLSTDTGHAAALVPHADELTTRASRGTPRYMAPEVLRGTAADARSDQYSWGVALFEALTGAPPFEAQTPAERLELMQEQSFEREPRYQALPPRLRAVLTRALAFQRLDRFDSMAAAARALEPPRRRGAALLAVAAALAVLALGGARWLATRCDGAGDALDATWGAAARAEVSRAIDATGVPFAAQVKADALARVDAWAQRWRGDRKALCEASWRGTAPAAVVALQFTCTERVQAALAAQLTALRTLDAQSVTKVVPALDAVPDPAACREVAELMSVDPPPAHPLVSTVEARLAQGLAETALGRHEAAHQGCAALLSDARTTGWRPLEARVARFCAFTQVRLSRADPDRLYERALSLALAGNDTQTAILALGGLVFLAGEKPRSGELAAEDAWMAVAEGLAQRHGLEASTAFCNALTNRSQVAYARRDYAATERYAARAVALQERSGHGDSDCANGARASRARGLAGLGRHAEALALLDRVLESTGAALGKVHHLALMVRSTKLIVASMMGDADAAYRAALDLLTLAEQGAPAATVTLAHQNVAERALVKGELARARAELGLVEGSPLAAPGSALAAWCRLFSAQLLLAEGRGRDAAERFAAVLADAKTLDLDEVDLASAEWGLALAEHAGRPDAEKLVATARRLAPKLQQDTAFARQQLQRWLPDAGSP